MILKILLPLILVCLIGLYYIFVTNPKLSIGKGLVEKAERYSNVSSDLSVTLLVLGDSTGVGVGADKSSDTIAALYASEIEATYIENYSVSGATIEDLDTQNSEAKLDSYDYILIQIGGNDIIRFHSLDTDKDLLKKLFTKLPETNSFLLMSAGNVGAATFFPKFMSPIYTKRTLKYHDMFTTLLTQGDGTYINLYEPAETDPFKKEPSVYLSADGLHPSSKGYALWFNKLKEQTNLEK
jgi:lysophospholipase L1-like esterase